MKKKYSERDLAIIIPTKDRPEKIQELLESIATQEISCGRVIVVASGMDIYNVVKEFYGRIPVEYYRSPVNGQIRQRNLGISLLTESTPLVCSFDDDIVVEQGAISEMVNFWNTIEGNAAGVSFNIVNTMPFRYSFFKSLIGMSSQKQGKVLLSGYNVLISPVKKNIKSQWLCGGATVWKKNILDKFVNNEVNSKWAICEDLIFSYPIGKQYPLFVCANAKVRHEHVYDHTKKMKHRYYGKTVTMWRFYFVELNPELSRVFFIWMIVGQIMARCLTGIILFQKNEIEYAFGQIEGLIKCITAIFKRTDVFFLIDEN